MSCLDQLEWMVQLCGASVVKEPSSFTPDQVSVWCPVRKDIVSCPEIEQDRTHESLGTPQCTLRCLTSP